MYSNQQGNTFLEKQVYIDFMKRLDHGHSIVIVVLDGDSWEETTVKDSGMFEEVDRTRHCKNCEWVTFKKL